MSLVLPMAVYVFYIFILAILNFRVRLGAIKTGQVPAKYFRDFLGGTSDERVNIVGRHYDNQFQAPMVFFATLCVFLALRQFDSVTVILAWGFVLSRFWHTYIHLGRNQLRKRVLAFALGWLILCAMWFQILFFHM